MSILNGLWLCNITTTRPDLGLKGGENEITFCLYSNDFLRS